MVAGAIVLELGDLRKVGGVNQQQAGDRARRGNDHNQQNEQGVANKFQPVTAWLGWSIGRGCRFFDNAFHVLTMPA